MRLRALLVMGVLVGAATFTPLTVDTSDGIEVVTNEACPYPSCVKKWNWRCVHGDQSWEDECDPNSNGCLGFARD